MPEDPAIREREDVRGAFSRHGHGFHYASVKACLELYRAGKSRWFLDATEFPVEVKGDHSHIDIVLRSQKRHAVLVIECKRSDPAVSRWCFARSAFGSGSVSEPDAVRLETAFWPEGDPQVVVQRPRPERSDSQYHVALEVRGKEKGDGSTSGRGAITDAVAQALRGASGLVNAIASGHSALLGRDRSLKIIPVVLTTARLLTCEVDLAEADLGTGDFKSMPVTERSWLWFRVNSTSHLRASVPLRQVGADTPPTAFGELADVEYARSVGIVSWNGLEEFFSKASYHVGDYF